MDTDNHAAHAAYAADFLANGPPPGAPRLVRQLAHAAGGGFQLPPMAGGGPGGGPGGVPPPPLRRQFAVGG